MQTYPDRTSPKTLAMPCGVSDNDVIGNEMSETRYEERKKGGPRQGVQSRDGNLIMCVLW